MPIRGDISRYAEGAMRNELGRLADAAEGTRNATLNSVAYRLGRLVGAGVIDPDSVEDALLARACASASSRLSAWQRSEAGSALGSYGPIRCPSFTMLA